MLGLADDEAERTLLSRCLVDGDLDADASTVVKAMEQVGSGLDTDFDAVCAECGAVLLMRFQLQDYLLGAIVADWHARVDDVHRIAGAYGWGLGEIMALPRRRRRAFIAILDDRPPFSGIVSRYLHRVRSRSAAAPSPNVATSGATPVDEHARAVRYRPGDRQPVHPRGDTGGRHPSPDCGCGTTLACHPGNQAPCFANTH